MNVRKNQHFVRVRQFLPIYRFELYNLCLFGKETPVASDPHTGEWECDCNTDDFVGTYVSNNMAGDLSPIMGDKFCWRIVATTENPGVCRDHGSYGISGGCEMAGESVITPPPLDPEHGK